MHTLRNTLLALLLLVTATGCELIGSDDDAPEGDFGGSVYVANQGNFGDGNGSVTVYDAFGETATTAVEGLGSIVQSLAVRGDRLYVLANTAERVDVFDADTHTRLGAVDEITSPRYMAFVDDGKAYVTSLYASNFTGGLVNVIDLATNTKTAEITVGNNPEGIVVVEGRAYVANHGFGGGGTLSVIDTGTDAVVSTVDVDCDGPRMLLADAEEDVWVFCTGQTLYDENYNVVGETNGAVRVLDGATGEIIRRFALDGRIGTAGPGQDAFYAPATREAYAVLDSRSVLRFNTASNTLDATLGPVDGDAIGAVAYAPDGTLYLGRVPGFTDRGAVTLHDREGAEVGRFTAGIAPSFIAFR